MENSKYVVFEILGVKKDDRQNSFVFDKDAECIINNDKYISKIQVSSDISKAIFIYMIHLRFQKIMFWE